MPYCTSCGEEISPETAFCGKCGKPITGPEIFFWLEIGASRSKDYKPILKQAEQERHYLHTEVDGKPVVAVGFEKNVNLQPYYPAFKWKGTSARKPGGPRISMASAAGRCFASHSREAMPCLGNEFATQSSLACGRLRTPPRQVLASMDPEVRKRIGLGALKPFAGCPRWDPSAVDPIWGIGIAEQEALLKGEVETVSPVLLVERNTPVFQPHYQPVLGKELWRVEGRGIGVLAMSPSGRYWAAKASDRLLLFSGDRILMEQDVKDLGDSVAVDDSGCVSAGYGRSERAKGVVRFAPSGELLMNRVVDHYHPVCEPSGRYAAVEEWTFVRVFDLQKNKALWQWPPEGWTGQIGEISLEIGIEKGRMTVKDKPKDQKHHSGTVKAKSIDSNGNLLVGADHDIVLYDKSGKAVFKRRVDKYEADRVGYYAHADIALITAQDMCGFCHSWGSGWWELFQRGSTLLYGIMMEEPCKAFLDPGAMAFGLISDQSAILMSSSGYHIGVAEGRFAQGAVSIAGGYVLLADGKEVICRSLIG